MFQFTGHLGLLCVSVILNANPLIYVLSSYIFMTESTASDIAGKFDNKIKVCVQGYKIKMHLLVKEHFGL